MRLSTSLAATAAARPAFLSLLLLASSLSLTPSVALAQEFDEFDEEFEEEEREEQRRQAEPPADEESELEEEDLESDEFGEEGEGEEAETPPAQQAAPTGYRGRGGDLLRDRPSDQAGDARMSQRRGRPADPRRGRSACPCARGRARSRGPHEPV